MLTLAIVICDLTLGEVWSVGCRRRVSLPSKLKFDVILFFGAGAKTCGSADLRFPLLKRELGFADSS